MDRIIRYLKKEWLDFLASSGSKKFLLAIYSVSLVLVYIVIMFIVGTLNSK